MAKLFIYFFFSKSLFFAFLSLFFIGNNTAGEFYGVYRMVWIVVLIAISIMIVLKRLKNNYWEIQKSTMAILSLLIFLAVVLFFNFFLLGQSGEVYQTLFYFFTITMPAVILAINIKQKDIDVIFRHLTFINIFLTLSFTYSLFSNLGIPVSQIAGGDHLMIGYAMAFLFPYNFMRVATEKLILKKCFYLILLVLNISLIGLVGARGAAVAILVCLIPLFVIYVFKKRRVLIFTTVGSVLVYFAYQFLKNNPNTSSIFWRFLYTFNNDIEDASSGRTNLYETAIEKFKDKPFLGNGAGSFGDGLNQYIYPHNIFLEVLHDFGVFGFTILLFILLIVFHRLLKAFKGTNRSIHILAFFFIISFVSLNLSGSYLVNPEFWMTLILLIQMAPNNNARLEINKKQVYKNLRVVKKSF